MKKEVSETVEIDAEMRDELIDEYEAVLRDFFSKGKDYDEGKLSGMEIILTKLNLFDMEDISEMQESVREEVMDADAEQKFYREHGFYPDDPDVNR